MGKVKKHQNTVYHGVPDRDYGVKTSSLECIDKVLNKKLYQISKGFHAEIPVKTIRSFEKVTAAFHVAAVTFSNLKTYERDPSADQGHTDL
jgi:hypothetical protein